MLTAPGALAAHTPAGLALTSASPPHGRTELGNRPEGAGAVATLSLPLVQS